MKTAKRKSWNEKLQSGKPAHVVTLEKAFAGVPAGSDLAIVSPMVVQQYVNEIPRGEVRSVQQMRESFAKKLGADTTCPTSTSIYLRIVSEAALERIQAGEEADSVCPFWRVVAPDSPLAAKLSCGPEFIRQRRLLEAE